jgi:hypothetical protein
MASGDILGLGGAPPPERADDEVTNREPSGSSGYESEEAKRRRRMSEGADELTPSTEHVHHHGSGATGIDMGSGGEGTDIE